MRNVEVSKRVWERILEIRSGYACHCCGLWTDGERAALDLYGPLARRDGAPLTIAQVGQSLDGRIATVTGDARDVSGKDGLAHLHRLRALVDGVVIGVGTALMDTPQLTVRMCSGESPTRIVIDPSGRLPDDAPLLVADNARRIVVQSVERMRAADVETIFVPATADGRIEPRRILEALRDAGLATLLIEGGGVTIANFLEEGLLSHLHVAIAPLIIGNGPQGLTTRTPIDRLADAIRPDARVFNLGSDILVDCGLSEDAAKSIVPMHRHRFVANPAPAKEDVRAAC